MTAPSSQVEDLEAFRLRARAWLADNMPRLSGNRGWLADDMARWQCARELQRKLFDGGFAGLCFPAEYGGWGLSLAHQHVLDEETDEYEMPILFNVPTIGIIGATLLDFGT